MIPNDQTTYYLVICRTDWDDHAGRYTIATRRLFETESDARAYADTVDYSREPIVVFGRFGSLRFPEVSDDETD